jgi:hypothetical protein
MAYAPPVKICWSEQETTTDSNTRLMSKAPHDRLSFSRFSALPCVYQNLVSENGRKDLLIRLVSPSKDQEKSPNQIQNAEDQGEAGYADEHGYDLDAMISDGEMAVIVGNSTYSNACHIAVCRDFSEQVIADEGLISWECKVVSAIDVDFVVPLALVRRDVGPHHDCSIRIKDEM